MTEENHDKATKLFMELKELNNTLNGLEYTQHENVVIRESFWKFNGIDGSITIPPILFKLFGKIAKAETLVKISEVKAMIEKL